MRLTKNNGNFEKVNDSMKKKELSPSILQQRPFIKEKIAMIHSSVFILYDGSGIGKSRVF